MFCAHKRYQFVVTSSDCGRYFTLFVTARREGQSRNTKSDSSDSLCGDTISYLVDVDSYIVECYADPEPLTGPQPYMHEPEAETVSVRVEDKQALSDGDGAQAEAVPHVSQ